MADVVFLTESAKEQMENMLKEHKKCYKISFERWRLCRI